MKQQILLAAMLCAVISSAYAADDAPLEIMIVTGTRFQDTYADKSVNVSVITQEEINKSSARTLPELLSEQAGISVRNLFGNNATSATVDLRGFGASARQNTLILLDGRRLTDPDLSGVPWPTISFDSIERIEIMRGSGAVLYGDGATSGVINIITKSSEQPGKGGQVSAKRGSYGMFEVQAGANYFTDTVGIDFFVSQLSSDGYRANSENKQTNVQAKTRWVVDAGELVLKAGMDRQDTQLPGGRLVQPSAGIDMVKSDPRGAATPLDYSSRDGSQIAVEWQQQLFGADVNFEMARRTKNQKSYFDQGGFPIYRDSDLIVTSLTPRIKLPHTLVGESTLIVGIDVYRWDYDLRVSNAVANIGQPINRVSMSQNNSAWYLQNTTHLSEATSVLAGVRSERISIDASDVYDASAPGAAFGSGAASDSHATSKNAYEFGLHHQLSRDTAIIGKIGRGFRFANIDEIYEFSPSFTKQFQFLRPQVSDTMELSVEQSTHDLNWRAALFNTQVRDEIHLDAFTSGIGNTNLPPSRRSGLELDGKWLVSNPLTINAAYAFTDARFRSGVLPGSASTQLNVNIAGKRVPLVPMHKLNLAAALMLNEHTLLNTSITYVDSQFMDNDEANTLGMKIPAYAITNIKLLHKTGAWQLSVSVNNLLDRKYYNYAVSSQFTQGKYNAYTLPGRTLFVGFKYQQ
ncbi:MAG: TonB-dependent receptor [Gallionella sp.]